MKYVIIAGIGTGLVTGIIGGFIGAKVKEWLDMRELKKMVGMVSNVLSWQKRIYW